MYTNPPEYYSYLISKRKKTNTIKSYIIILRAYSKWLYNSSSVTFFQLNRTDILNYKDYLITQKLYSERSINHALTAMKKFNEYLVFNNYQEEMVILKIDFLKISIPREPRPPVHQKEVSEFLDKLKEFENPRDYLIVNLMINSNLTLNTILNTKLNDLNLPVGIINFRNSNHKIVKSFYLNKNLRDLLSQYLKFRQTLSTAYSSEYLFISQKSESLNRTVINRLFNKYSPSLKPSDLKNKLL